MGMTSDWAIELHNERMATDEQYAADYEEAMRMDAALEAEFFAAETENQKRTDWFGDVRIDYTGYTEIVEPAEREQVIIDEDIPF